MVHAPFFYMPLQTPNSCTLVLTEGKALICVFNSPTTNVIQLNALRFCCAFVQGQIHSLPIIILWLYTDGRHCAEQSYQGGTKLIQAPVWSQEITAPVGEIYQKVSFLSVFRLGLKTEKKKYSQRECQADVTWSVCPSGVHNGEMDISVSFCPLFRQDNLLSLGQNKKSQTSIKFNSLSTKLVPREVNYIRCAVNTRAFMYIHLLIPIGFIG